MILQIRQFQQTVLAARQDEIFLGVIRRWMVEVYPEKYALLSAEALDAAVLSQVRAASRFRFESADLVIRYTDVQHRVGPSFPDELARDDPMRAILATNELNPVERMIALERIVFPSPSPATL